MAALQAEHFITAHSAGEAVASPVPVEADSAGVHANGAPAPAPAADGGRKFGPKAGGGGHMTAAEKAAIDKEADEFPMMAVL